MHAGAVATRLLANSADMKKLSFEDFFREYEALKRRAQRINARYKRAMLIIGMRVVRPKKSKSMYESPPNIVHN